VMSRWRRLILVVLPFAAVGLILALNGPSLGRVHPNQSKAAIIDAALHGYDATAFSRVEAKLMHRRDLQRAAKELIGLEQRSLGYCFTEPPVGEHSLGAGRRALRLERAPIGRRGDETASGMTCVEH